MTIQDFKASIDQPTAPENLTIQMESLWWDAKGNWYKAHELIDQLEDPISAHIHAYLHRVEGDLWNARYWYNRAGKPAYTGDLAQEWEMLVKMYL